VALRAAPDARVVAEDEEGRPAAVFRRLGKGATLYLGSFPVPRDPFGAEGLAALVADFATLAGAERPAVVEGRGGRVVEARLLEGAGARHLLVILNAEAEPQELAVRVPGRRLGDAVDLETGERHELGHGPGGARLTVRLEAGDARAYRVEQIG
jgi:hypothetical protein